MLKRINKTIIKLSLILVLVIAILVSPSRVDAASMYLLPSTSSVSVGNIVLMKVYINTSSQTINNAEATIQFPTDLLDVISITKNSSIFSLWVEEPRFSNSAGKITFNGGVPNPGYIGANGYVASITFKAKKQGTASVIFSDGAIRANDGLGTDILTGKSTGVINITAPIKEESKTTIVTPVKNNNTNKVTETTFDPSIRFEGNNGIVKLSDDKNISNIDYYTLAIDDNPSFKVKKDQLYNYEYYLPILTEGNHSVTVVTFDKTGKYNESTLDFIAPPISIPLISLNSYNITTGDSAIITGETNYPNSKIVVVLELNSKEIKRYEQTTRTDGTFSITTDKIKEIGQVNIWAESVLSSTVKSAPSERVYLKVNERKAVRLTLSILYPLLWFIVIFALISLLLLLLSLGWHKFFSLRRRIKKESKQTIIEAHNAMLLLKDELANQLKALERVKKDRNLNEKEEAIFAEIEKNIDGVDTFIEKKLKKII